MGQTLMYVAAMIGLTAVAIGATILAVRRDGRDVDVLVKQLIVWASIAALLPLTSYAGATMLHPRTRLDDLQAEQERLEKEAYDPGDSDARKKTRDRAEELRKEIVPEQRDFYRAMFRVGYPIGFAALVIGLLLRAVPVGMALAFGGLCTLTTGCYSYWDSMGDSLRFYSLLLVLVVVMAIGLIKFGRPLPPRAGMDQTT